ncbi:hypothetical protein CEP54_004774 [Fusarium duplospermum]|uniref:Uncharacterized protein n=1 Tax=Fusarium duplospermum TaxID=1325734 RepID=A0A428QGC8_9HYPO|nr:hypothetical protein CEP54_004774 [Fusarium duplospermum]
MADNENTKAQAEEDRLLMPPPPLPTTRRIRSSPKKGSPQKTAGTSMTLRPRKNKNKGKGKGKVEPEPVATTTGTDTADNTGTHDTADTTGTNENTDTKEPEDDNKKLEDVTKTEDGTEKPDDATKKPEDDLPPIKPLNWRERLLFPGIMEPTVYYDVPMSAEVRELWRALAPQAGDRMLTVDEVDKLCDEFYKESRE